MVFSKIFGKSNKRKSAKSTDTELQQAAAVHLYKMAKTDGVADKTELIHLQEMLRKEFKLQQAELNELTQYATQTDVSSQPIEVLTQEICRNFGNSKRIKMLEYLWVLAFADDRIDKREAELVNQVAQLLFLSEGEIARAQENAENALGIGF